ncbi:MAG: hypothetical protein DRJ40_05785 [Thermoprotei archaeon]|nr:MAG: hypothetical protein DRJ40_05785 [Thermoprotei archaeon]
MRLSDVAYISWKQLSERKLRSALIVLAISIGVVAVVAVAAQVEGLKVNVLSILEKLGPTTILIRPTPRYFLTSIDVAKLRTIEHVKEVIPIIIERITVVVGSDTISTTIVGIDSDKLGSVLGEVKLVEGSTYVDAPIPAALVGYNIAFDVTTGEKRIAVAQSLIARKGSHTIPLTVIGILSTYGAAPFISPDDSIFVPLKYLLSLRRRPVYDLIIVKVDSTDHVDEVTEMIKILYGRNVQVISLKFIATQVTSVLTAITVFGLSAAVTAFIAASFGTANVMTISVLERTRLIGTLKAIGMTDTAVLLIYVVQALILGMLGAAVGIPLGAACAYMLNAILSSYVSVPGAPHRARGPGLVFKPVFTPEYIALATVLAIASALVASVYPAWRAARLRPAEALRYE